MTVPGGDLAAVNAQLANVLQELKAIRQLLSGAPSDERTCPYCHTSSWTELGTFGQEDYRIMCDKCGAQFTKEAHT